MFTLLLAFASHGCKSEQAKGYTGRVEKVPLGVPFVPFELSGLADVSEDLETRGKLAKEASKKRVKASKSAKPQDSGK